MKLGGVKKASEQKSENEPIKKYKKVVKTSTDSNRGLSVLLACMGVVIVGLVVAIVVVKNLPKPQEPQVEEVSIDDETEYYAISNEIWRKIARDEAEMDGEKILALYKERIEETTDEDTKLMLTMDYYEFVMMYDTNYERKTEIEEAMLAADEKLKTPLSAAKVISMAISYDNQELKAKYTAILDERVSEMDK